MSYEPILMTDSEAVYFAVDFSPKMDDSSAIVSSNSQGTTEVLVFDYAGNDTTSTMVESGSQYINGQVLGARIQGGTVGTKYKIHYKAATSDGDFIEEKIPVRVLD